MHTHMHTITHTHKHHHTHNTQKNVLDNKNLSINNATGDTNFNFNGSFLNTNSLNLVETFLNLKKKKLTRSK